jgi:two-component system secretion response regulator SsrB
MLGAGANDQTMSTEAIKCVLLADRHHGLTEGMRGLLETEFAAVVMVADENSLFETATRLHPSLAVVDLSLARGDNLRWLCRLRARCPDLKLILISVHDEPSVCRSVMEAGANGFVFKRAIATDLLPAVDAVLAGGSYVSRAKAVLPSGGQSEPALP